jgi:hypothetical protein
MMNVAVTGPVAPEYVVASVSAPIAVKLPLGPNVKGPETESIALDTAAPAPNLESIVAGAPVSV